MSPADHRDEELEAMLTRPLPYLDDDGFTARVVERLPPSPSRWRRLVVLSVTGAIVAVAAFLLPVGTFLPQTFVNAATLPRNLSMLPIASWMVVALIVWAAIGLASAEDR